MKVCNQKQENLHALFQASWPSNTEAFSEPRTLRTQHLQNTLKQITARQTLYLKWHYTINQKAHAGARCGTRLHEDETEQEFQGQSLQQESFVRENPTNYDEDNRKIQLQALSRCSSGWSLLITSCPKPYPGMSLRRTSGTLGSKNWRGAVNRRSPGALRSREMAMSIFVFEGSMGGLDELGECCAMDIHVVGGVGENAGPVQVVFCAFTKKPNRRH